MRVSTSLSFGVLGLLTACGSSPERKVVAPSPAQIALAAKAVPDDAALAAVYDRSCKSCHALINTGAPLTGHGAAWKPRLDARGEAGLLNSAKAGLNAMPAMGLCADCSDEQLTALTRFMATEGK